MPVDIEKRNTRQNAWQKENKDRINFLMDKGTKDRIKIAASKTRQTSSEFIREAIEEKLFRCGVEKQIAVTDPEAQEPKK